MASAAEQMAANISWGTFAKAKELQQRILFALALLIVYRVGTFIPVPGIDSVALQQFVEQAQGGIGGILNMFSGGAIGRMAIFALGIMPYISSAIIVQLLAAMVPQLEQLKKEGEQGRKKINQYTRYGTVFLATFQAFGLAKGLEASELVTNPGFMSFQLPCVITLVGGTMFLMWLGEQITARGIGNGISLIIFVGIIAELPAALAQFFSQGRSGVLSPAVIIGVMVMVAVVIALVVFMERALRKVHIQYPKRQAANNRMYGGQSSHLPIKLNPSGVIPPIFASALLLLPTTVSTFSGTQTSPFMNTLLAYFGPGQPLYLTFFVAMIVFFAYFYTANVSFKTEDIADNLKPAERLCSGNSAWPANGGVSRLRGHALAGSRFRVSFGGVPVAGNPEGRTGDSILFRRNVVADRGFGHDGHDHAGPVSSSGPPVREPDREVETEGAQSIEIAKPGKTVIASAD